MKLRNFIAQQKSNVRMTTESFQGWITKKDEQTRGIYELKRVPLWKTHLILPKPERRIFFPTGDQSHYFHQGWIIHGKQLQASQKGDRKKSLARAQPLPRSLLEKNNTQHFVRHEGQQRSVDWGDTTMKDYPERKRQNLHDEDWLQHRKEEWYNFYEAANRFIPPSLLIQLTVPWPVESIRKVNIS